jgi:tRNA A37 threonylcarbamoyladenosine dehydratase
MDIDPKFQRLALLSGASGLEALAGSRVLVVGLGGVGSWAAEALVRSGLGRIALVDNDRICITNINRQVEADVHSIGRFKTEALAERLQAINPACKIELYTSVFSQENAPDFDIPHADYVIDAIDSIRYKLDLIESCTLTSAKLFSSMGTACKLDPLRLKTADIWDTHSCPLARIVREGLRKRGYSGHFTCVYSDEQVQTKDDIPVSCGTDKCLCCKSGDNSSEWCSKKAVINGSAVFVTAAAGMILASLVVKDCIDV